MLTAVLNALSPVFLLIALGYLLRRYEFLPRGFFTGLNKLTYWVGLPILLFIKIGTASLDLESAYRLSAVILASISFVALISMAIAYWTPVPPASRGAFIQAAFRGNQAFVGLPIIIYSLEAVSAGPASETLAAIVIGPMVVYFNLLAVPLLVYTRPKNKARAGGHDTGSWWKPLALNPLIIASALGLIVSGLNIALPTFAERSLLSIGETSLPLALLAIGAGLSRESLRGKIKLSMIVTALKCIVGPLIAYALCLYFDFTNAETLIASIYLATPTAVASYVLAQQLRADEDLASSAVVMSTLFSILSLAVIIGVLS